MASKAAVAAILDRAATKAGSPPKRTWMDGAGRALPVFGPNERPLTPMNASEFIDFEFPVSTSEQITVGAPGANVYREEGVFRMLIAARRNTGTDQALTWADELAALYRGKDFGGVRTYAPNPPTMDDSNDNGGYFIVSVAVPYERDILG